MSWASTLIFVTITVLKIENHPMFKRITMIQGSSIDKGVVKQVNGFAGGEFSVLVALDSCHTHDHVLGNGALLARLSRRAVIWLYLIRLSRICRKSCTVTVHGAKEIQKRR